MHLISLNDISDCDEISLSIYNWNLITISCDYIYPIWDELHTAVSRVQKILRDNYTIYLDTY